MSSSVGASSGLNLQLLNQLLQRAEGGAGTEATASSGTDAGSFTSQADQLFTALDSDGDGKLSKAEIQTGFQKLSGSMQAVLLQQQGSTADSDVGAATATDSTGAATAFNSLDTDGDGAISESEFAAGFGADSSQAGKSGQDSTTTIDAAELLTSLLQSLRASSSAALFKSFDSNGDGSVSQSEFTAGLSAASESSAGAGSTASDITASTTSPASTSSTSTSSTGSTLFSALDSNDDGSISSDEWSKLLKDLQASEPGDLANQSAMAGLQHSSNLNTSLMFMLQSVDPSQMTTAATASV